MHFDSIREPKKSKRLIILLEKWVFLYLDEVPAVKQNEARPVFFKSPETYNFILFLKIVPLVLQKSIIKKVSSP